MTTRGSRFPLSLRIALFCLLLTALAFGAVQSRKAPLSHQPGMQDPGPGCSYRGC